MGRRSADSALGVASRALRPYADFMDSIGDQLSARQQRFFARVAYWLPLLLSGLRRGSREALLGRRKSPDGDEIEVLLVCRVVKTHGTHRRQVDRDVERIGEG